VDWYGTNGVGGHGQKIYVAPLHNAYNILLCQVLQLPRVGVDGIARVTTHLYGPPPPTPPRMDVSSQTEDTGDYVLDNIPEMGLDVKTSGNFCTYVSRCCP